MISGVVLIGLCWQFFEFLHVFLCATCGWVSWTLIIFNWIFPVFELKNIRKSLFFPWCHRKLFLAFNAFVMQFAWFEAKINASAIFLLIYDKKIVDCTYHTEHWTATEMPCRCVWQQHSVEYSEDSVTMAPNSRRLY